MKEDGAARLLTEVKGVEPGMTKDQIRGTKGLKGKTPLHSPCDHMKRAEEVEEEAEAEIVDEVLAVEPASGATKKVIWLGSVLTLTNVKAAAEVEAEAEEVLASSVERKATSQENVPTKDPEAAMEREAVEEAEVEDLEAVAEVLASNAIKKATLRENALTNRQKEDLTSAREGMMEVPTEEMTTEMTGTEIKTTTITTMRANRIGEIAINGARTRTRTMMLAAGETEYLC